MANPETKSQLCTVFQTAQQLGVEEKTIRNWMAGGQLPYLKILDGAVRIRQSVIEQILADADAPYQKKIGAKSVRHSGKVGAA